MPQTGRHDYQRWVMWRISTKCIHSREQFLILEARFPADAERRHIADSAAQFASRWLSGYGRLRSQRGMPWHRGIPLKYATAELYYCNVFDASNFLLKISFTIEKCPQNKENHKISQILVWQSTNLVEQPPTKCIGNSPRGHHTRSHPFSWHWPRGSKDKVKSTKWP